MVLFMFMLRHVCDPHVTHVRTYAIQRCVLAMLCHACHAHVISCESCLCTLWLLSAAIVAQAAAPAFIMAARVTGCREEKFYDSLIAEHVHQKPKLTTKLWTALDPAIVAGHWSELLTEVAASGNKIHVATFSSRLDNYFGCCTTHKAFAETMQKTLSHCRSKCKGSRIQSYSDLGSRQPDKVQKIILALMSLKERGSRESLSSGGARQGDEVMAIADSDEDRTLPCKASPAKRSCVDEVVAFFSETDAPSSSSTSRKLAPVISVCSSPGKSAKDSDVEDVPVDLPFHFTCRGFVLSACFHEPYTSHGPDHHCTCVACQHANVVVRLCPDAQTSAIQEPCML